MFPLEIVKAGQGAIQSNVAAFLVDLRHVGGQ